MKATLDNVEWQLYIRRVSVNKTSPNVGIITSASWSLEAEYIDDDGEQYLEGYADTTILAAANQDDFISLNNVSNDIVISWVESVEADRMDSIKNKIITKINKKAIEEVNTTLN